MKLFALLNIFFLIIIFITGCSNVDCFNDVVLRRTAISLLVMYTNIDGKL